MLRRFWRKPTTEVDQVNEHLNEVYGVHGPAHEKLRGLVHCIRSRKTSGYEQQAIAARAMMTLDSVTAIVGGRFNGIRWDSVEALLRALDATQAEIAVALQLFEEIRKTSLTPTYGPRRTDSLFTPSEVKLNPVAMSRLVSAIDDEMHGMQDVLAGMAESFSPSPAAPPTIPMPRAEDDAPEPKEDVGKLLEEDVVDFEGEEPKELEETPKEVPETEVDETVPLGPDAVETVRDLIMGVQAFRLGKGKKPLRKMAKECTRLNMELEAAGLPTIEPYSIGSFSNLIRDGLKGKLPSKGLLRAYIVGAGGDVDDLKQWVQARNRLEIKALSEDDPLPP